MTREALVALCGPVVDRLGAVDLADPAAAERALEELDTAALAEAAREAWREGWLTPKEAGGVRFGRLARPAPELHGFSIDAVEMDGPAAGPHEHPRGEVELCVPVQGDPAFDGRRARWIAYPPGSRHVPTVTGGRMVILYFLPGGEIVFA